MGFAMSATLRAARLTQILAALDAASTPARILFYATVQPAAGAAAGGTAIAAVTLAQPAGSVTGTVLQITVPENPGQFVADGTIVWARFVDGNDTWIADADVTESGGDGTVTVTPRAGYTGGYVKLTSGSIAE